jgi:hypothetical protein
VYTIMSISNSMPESYTVAVRTVDADGYALSLVRNLFTGKEGLLLVGYRSGSGYRGGRGGRGMGMSVGFDDGHR